MVLPMKINSKSLFNYKFKYVAVDIVPVMIYKPQKLDCICVKSLDEMEQVNLNLCSEINSQFELIGGADYFATYWKGKGNTVFMSIRTLFLKF